jgi:hypothetical protein
MSTGENRPDDPRTEWTPATGPQGDVSVHQNEDGTWNIWSESDGFSTLEPDEFEEGYELDIGASTLDQDQD